jgi:cytoskeletal protein RodZ
MEGFFKLLLLFEKDVFELSVLAQRTKRKEIVMKKSYVKSLKEYDEPFELDSKKILAAMKRYKDARKKPTSVALDEKTIQELKKMAHKFDIPYQVLIRVFILDGLERLKRAA